jgi:hypothetical protein
MQRVETFKPGDPNLPFVVQYNCEWGVRLFSDLAASCPCGKARPSRFSSFAGSVILWQSPAGEHEKTPPKRGFQAGRSEMIRTSDPHVPNVVRYQAALHSVTSGASIDQRFCEYKRGHDKITTERRIFSAPGGKRLFCRVLPQAFRAGPRGGQPATARRAGWANAHHGRCKRDMLTHGSGRWNIFPSGAVAQTHQTENLGCVAFADNFPWGFLPIKASGERATGSAPVIMAGTCILWCKGQQK